MKGEINDPDVAFTKGIQVGMSEAKFLNVFFEDFPERKRYKVIKLAFCVDAADHIYRFSNNQLQSISLLNDTSWFCCGGVHILQFPAMRLPEFKLYRGIGR
ncbi:hypothetical protein [Mucilaginibacter sp. CSA2-8R]|uniref:hypothetical protein n=1 Tax=Mucilaginibacter sp. CSA2-8R TaxID=3141542 RepID=UPI00315D4FB3